MSAWTRLKVHSTECTSTSTSPSTAPNSTPSLFAKAKLWAGVPHGSDKSGSVQVANTIPRAARHSNASAHDSGAETPPNDLKFTFGQSEAFLLKIATKAGRCNEREALPSIYQSRFHSVSKASFKRETLLLQRKDGGALTLLFLTRLHTQCLQYPVPLPSHPHKKHLFQLFTSARAASECCAGDDASPFSYRSR